MFATVLRTLKGNAQIDAFCYLWAMFDSDIMSTEDVSRNTQYRELQLISISSFKMGPIQVLSRLSKSEGELFLFSDYFSSRR